jgi:hypothetical protein
MLTRNELPSSFARERGVRRHIVGLILDRDFIAVLIFVITGLLLSLALIFHDPENASLSIPFVFMELMND